MIRSDLLSLSMDDLAATTNRGTVKRAQKELDAGQLSYEFSESDAGLTVAWSDSTVCVFPADQTIHGARCSSGAVGISRHVIRSVLAYQKYVGDGPQTTDSGRAWNPGDLTDETLIKCFRKLAITKARKIFNQGVLVELTRGAKPSARFLHESCTVRFPVPGDVRYARADCAESLLPKWVSMAVWAFRELPHDRVAGLLSLQQTDLATPHELLIRLRELFGELATDGIAGVNGTWPQRLTRLEKQMRKEGLVWPAELILELVEQYDRYQQQDARFSPAEMVRLSGELIARSRAIESRIGAVPQTLIRGNKSDRPIDIKAGRFVGLGLGVRPGRRHTTMLAYFQDTDTGTVAAVRRVFSDPPPETEQTPKSFSDLASHSLHRGVSLAGASMSQLLLGSGKRTPTDELVLPRGTGKLTTNPQTFQWEQLAAPLAVETFSQVRQRLESLPPDWLRPRRYTENLHVFSVADVRDTEFDVVHQTLNATLVDAAGESSQLIHPYHVRGDQGFAQLLQTLRTCGAKLRFVCGRVQLVHQQLQIQPITVVLDNPDGTRSAVSAWLGGGDVTLNEQNLASEMQEPHSSPIAEFTANLQNELAEVLVTGLQHASPQAWDDLRRAAVRIGFVRLALPIEALANELTGRLNQLRWESTASLQCVEQLCMLSRMLE